MTRVDHFATRLEGTTRAVESVREQLDMVMTMATCLRDRLAGGGTVYAAGNGGSATQATHLTEELVGRYRSNRRPLSAVSFAADPAALTCIANDFGFDEVFARQAEAMLTKADVLVALSTSGHSPNVIRVLEVARGRGTTTLGLLGKDGGPALALCDHAIVVPGADSAPIQEAHLVVIHLLCEFLEDA